MKVSIIPMIIKKLKQCFALVEDGTTASQNIAKGKYVIWKGVMCRAASAISSGDTLSSTNLTEVSGGGLNQIGDYLAKLGTYPAVVSGQYTTAAWTSGSWSSGGVWSAPEDGIYLAYMWIQLNSEYSGVAYRKYYRQLQMQGTCTRLLQNPLYYDTGVTEDSAFEGRCITQPIYAKAGQTLYPYVHTDAVGCVYDYKIFCIRIA